MLNKIICLNLLVLLPSIALSVQFLPYYHIPVPIFYLLFLLGSGLFALLIPWSIFLFHVTLALKITPRYFISKMGSITILVIRISFIFIFCLLVNGTTAVFAGLILSPASVLHFVYTSLYNITQCIFEFFYCYYYDIVWYLMPLFFRKSRKSSTTNLHRGGDSTPHHMWL